MARLLCFDTSSKHCSVVLGDESGMLAEEAALEEGFSHAEKLHPYIQSVLEQSGLQLDQLDGIALGLGPGSYTGLRIGMSAAKGLAYSLKLPLIGISSLEVLVQPLIGKVNTPLIGAIVDARRQEVYFAIFDAEGNRMIEDQAFVLDQQEWPSILSQQSITWVGDGIEKLRSNYHQESFEYHGAELPNSRHLLPIAQQAFAKKSFLDAAYAEPAYLKAVHVTQAKK